MATRSFCVHKSRQLSAGSSFFDSLHSFNAQGDDRRVWDTVGRKPALQILLFVPPALSIASGVRGVR